MLLEQLCQVTFVFRVKVCNDHKCQAGVGGQRAQERLQCIQPTGGCTDANNRQASIPIRGFYWSFGFDLL
jgi:hypothetical protein